MLQQDGDNPHLIPVAFYLLDEIKIIWSGVTGFSHITTSILNSLPQTPRHSDPALPFESAIKSHILRNDLCTSCCLNNVCGCVYVCVCVCACVRACMRVCVREREGRGRERKRERKFSAYQPCTSDTSEQTDRQLSRCQKPNTNQYSSSVQPFPGGNKSPNLFRCILVMMLWRMHRFSAPPWPFWQNRFPSRTCG